MNNYVAFYENTLLGRKSLYEKKNQSKLLVLKNFTFLLLQIHDT